MAERLNGGREVVPLGRAPIKGAYNAVFDLDGVLLDTPKHQEKLRAEYPRLFTETNLKSVASDDGLTVGERALKVWYHSNRAFIHELEACDKAGDGLEKIKSDGQFKRQYVVTARLAFLKDDIVERLKFHHLWEFFDGIYLRKSPKQSRARSKIIHADRLHAILAVEDDGTQIYDISERRLAVLIDKKGDSFVRNAAPDPCIKIYHDVKEFTDELTEFGDIGGLFGFHYYKMGEKWEEYRRRVEEQWQKAKQIKQYQLSQPSQILRA